MHKIDDDDDDKNEVVVVEEETESLHSRIKSSSFEDYGL